MPNNMDGGLENAEVVYLQPSNLENIDAAVYEWVDEHLNINTETHEGFKKVPVIWVTAERSFQIKNSEDLHDSDGALIYPLITVGRTGFSKDISKKGAIYAPLDPVNDYRGGVLKITKQINNHNQRNYDLLWLIKLVQSKQRYKLKKLVVLFFLRNLKQGVCVKYDRYILLLERHIS